MSSLVLLWEEGLQRAGAALVSFTKDSHLLHFSTAGVGVCLSLPRRLLWWLTGNVRGVWRAYCSVPSFASFISVCRKDFSVGSGIRT